MLTAFWLKTRPVFIGSNLKILDYYNVRPARRIFDTTGIIRQCPTSGKALLSNRTRFSCKRAFLNDVCRPEGVSLSRLYDVRQMILALPAESGYSATETIHDMLKCADACRGSFTLSCRARAADILLQGSRLPCLSRDVVQQVP